MEVRTMSETYELIDTHGNKERSKGSYTKLSDAEADRIDLEVVHFERIIAEIVKLSKKPVSRPTKTITMEPEQGTPEALFNRKVKVKVENEDFVLLQKKKAQICPSNPRYVIRTTRHSTSRRYS